MKLSRPVVLFSSILVLGVIGATPVSAALCDINPLDTVLADYIEFGSTTQTCDWRSQFQPAFNNWSGGGSQNKPVVAAAIKLWADGDTAARTWWSDFLKNQLGDVDDPNLPLKVRHFHSTELFASGYDTRTVSAVAAARLWYQTHGNPDGTLDLTRRWLRATWVTYALAAGSVKMQQLYSINCGATPESKAVPGLSQTDTFVQLPSPRSKDEAWQLAVPSFFRARSNLSNPVPKSYEPDPVKRLWNVLQAQWTRTDWSVYGLNQPTRDLISGIINNTTFDPGTLYSILGNTRFWVNLHILAFDGSRVAFLEPNGANGLHEKIIFAVRFDNNASPPTAWMLAPWWGDSQGLGSSSYDLTARTVTAVGNCGTAKTLDMPTGNIRYHVKLGTTGVTIPIHPNP